MSLKEEKLSEFVQSETSLLNQLLVLQKATDLLNESDRMETDQAYFDMVIDIQNETQYIINNYNIRQESFAQYAESVTRGVDEAALQLFEEYGYKPVINGIPIIAAVIGAVGLAISIALIGQFLTESKADMASAKVLDEALANNQITAKEYTKARGMLFRSGPLDGIINTIKWVAFGWLGIQLYKAVKT